MDAFLYVSVLLLIKNVKAETLTIHTTGEDENYNFFPMKCKVAEFSVKATEDVHVVLTQTNTFAAPFYEFVIGGWQNTITAIYKDNKDEIRESINETILMNGKEFKKFWVKTNLAQKIVSLSTEEKDPYLYYLDPYFAPMSFFGLSTGKGVEGEFHVNIENLVNCTDKNGRGRKNSRFTNGRAVYAIENLNIINE